MLYIFNVPAGLWGSAFTILLQRVLREGKLPDDTIEEMSNPGDLREELSMWSHMIFIHNTFNRRKIIAVLSTTKVVVKKFRLEPAGFKPMTHVNTSAIHQPTELSSQLRAGHYVDS